MPEFRFRGTEGKLSVASIVCRGPNGGAQATCDALPLVESIASIHSRRALLRDGGDLGDSCEKNCGGGAVVRKKGADTLTASDERKFFAVLMVQLCRSNIQRRQRGWRSY